MQMHHCKGSLSLNGDSLLSKLRDVFEARRAQNSTISQPFAVHEKIHEQYSWNEKTTFEHTPREFPESTLGEYLNLRIWETTGFSWIWWNCMALIVKCKCVKVLSLSKEGQLSLCLIVDEGNATKEEVLFEFGMIYWWWCEGGERSDWPNNTACPL